MININPSHQCAQNNACTKISTGNYSTTVHPLTKINVLAYYYAWMLCVVQCVQCAVVVIYLFSALPFVFSRLKVSAPDPLPLFFLNGRYLFKNVCLSVCQFFIILFLWRGFFSIALLKQVLLHTSSTTVQHCLHNHIS